MKNKMLELTSAAFEGNMEESMSLLMPILTDCDVDEDFSEGVEKIKDEVPILPLRNMVLFPGVAMPVIVGRSKSLNLIQKYADKRELIGVVCQRDASTEDPKRNDLHDTGAIADILRVLDMPDGSTTIILQGKKRFKLLELTQDEPHLRGKIQLLEDKKPAKSDKEFNALIGAVKDLMIKILMTSSEPQRELIFSLKNNRNALYTINFGCANLLPSIAERQLLLMTDALKERAYKLMTFLNREFQLLELKASIQMKTQEDLDKQQKEYLLREKIRAIKKELGEDPSKDSTSTIEKLENNPYPEEVKNKIKDELKRKEMMPQGSLEARLIQDYIDIVFSIPWFEQTEDDNDIDHAKAVLDEDHYGLIKVKERIIEYLCVKKFKGNLKAPILCFYGPPGCGKTSLSRSIARALGRKFIKCSLGGVSDEAEIRGHRRTYVGSRPGRIINSLRKVKVNNPVFLLDEIDKLGRDSFKGDPSSALLEVLDPEQNKEFADNYLEISYDLSNVLFICTANNIENIPAPLLDRLELIHVPSYTAIDKLHIATDFLIKKQLDTNGLKEGSITFDDESIYYIIDRYTREAGVRDLERNIASIIRKVIVEKVKEGLNTDFKVNITIKDVIKYLGVEPFDSTSKEKGKQVGVVTGLAYTDYGGDILAIEVNYFAGGASGAPHDVHTLRFYYLEGSKK